MSQVTVRELARRMAELLERVADGEIIEITRNGTPVAIMTAPDPVEARAEQTELSDWFKEHPPLPAQPGEPPLSELLHRMRAEERS